MKIRIDHLDANPFRHIERYPIREEKIAALRESMGTTGFWDNLVGRQVGDRVQIAYGHHRREALVREYPADHEVGIVVRDFDDDQMLQIMARESMEEWGSSAMVEMETVRAVVEAYGARQIELAGPSSDTSKRFLRFAPTFAMGDGPLAEADRPYTATTVAQFLGWVQASGDLQRKVQTALSALEYIEAGHLTDNDFFGLSTKQAEALVEQTRRLIIAERREEQEAAERAEKARRAREEADRRAEQAAKERAEALARAKEAREQADRDRAEQEWKDKHEAAERADKQRRTVARAAEQGQRQDQAAAKRRDAERRRVTDAVTQDLRSGGGYKNARRVADEARNRTAKDAAPPDIAVFATRLAGQLHRMFDPEFDQDRVPNLTKLIWHREQLPAAAKQELARELSALAARVTGFRDLLTHQTDTKTAGAGDEVADADIVDAEVVDEQFATTPKEDTN